MRLPSWLWWVGIGLLVVVVLGGQAFLYNKTMWDVTELIGVPLAVVVVATLFTLAANRRERDAERQRDERQREIEALRIEQQREIESDRARVAALQTCLGRMAELIRDGLRESQEEDAKRSIARAYTLTALRQLDGERKGLLLRFLYEAGLIGGAREREEERITTVVNLAEGDLSEADLSGATVTPEQLAEAASIEDAIMPDSESD